MRRVVVATGAVAALVAAGACVSLWWRDHRRVGSSFVNRVVNPRLVRSGLIDRTRGELALLEHVGRVSGTVRATPVHVVPTDRGVRIVAPLGTASQWAQNVLAAGHCRIQVGEVVQEFDEPALVEPTEVAGIAPFAARWMSWLGFRYLVLHRFAEHQGLLEVAPPEELHGESERTEVSPGAEA